MNLLSSFQSLLQSAEKNRPDALELLIEDKIYTRNFRPHERLLLLGGGHVSQPVCSFASELGFSVTVADDRPSFANRELFPKAEELICSDFPSAIRQFGIHDQDYVAIVTRGHRWDAECLREILPGTFPRYLGMIGSKRRTISLLKLLEEDGFSRTLLDQIHTPIGLDIGALTTKEIGISIVAELIACRRKDMNRRSKSLILTNEDSSLPLLQFLADPDFPKVLMLVYETSGSTPVKSGALMAVDQNFRTSGTIGGGCSENTILREAYRMVGTGQQRCMSVDLSNDLAEEEGMVCGGRMKVWLADVSGSI